MDTTKLFRSGNSQAVRLPKKYRFSGNQVFITKVGEVVILFPFSDPWRILRNSLHLFSDDFMETRNQPEEQTRENLFT